MGWIIENWKKLAIVAAIVFLVFVFFGTGTEFIGADR